MNTNNNEINILINQKNEIEKKLKKLYKEKIDLYKDNKELVKDDNPYSRLYALKKMGLVNNYEDISKKTIIIVGVGGVGSVASEMMTRLGVGKLILFDYDNVELANMNRLFFTPNQVGISKVEAAKLTLQNINPNIEIEIFNMNITTTNNYELMIDLMNKGGLNKNKVDLIFSCVDNYSARMSINSACNSENLFWLESGVSEDALSCHYQIIIPGETACFACIPPTAFLEKNEHNIKREGVCAASLPTTMSMTAGFMCHTALKLLLEFEDICYYLQYNARSETFTRNILKPNEECLDLNCLKNQKTRKEKNNFFIEKRKNIINNKKPKEETLNIKELRDNALKWNIEVVVEEEKEIKKEIKVNVKEMNLEDLQNQLKNL